MRLQAYCKNCQKYSKVNSNAISRFDLRQEKEEEFSQQCTNCHSYMKVHVNQVTATSGVSIQLLYILLLVALVLVGTLYLLGLGWISTATLTVPFAVYFILQNQEQEKISTFNRIRV